MTAMTPHPSLPDPAGLETSLSPVDLPGDAPGEGAPLRWTTQIVAVVCAVLSLLNATAIRSWASELSPGPTTEPIIAAADAWYVSASRLGLTAPIETMHLWWESAREVHFPGQGEAVPARSADRDV